MHVASLELCKELYELSGWMGISVVLVTEKDGEVVTANFFDDRPNKMIALYDLGYLLRKLAPAIRTMSASDQFSIFQQMLNGNPEDVLVREAIELHKQGVLTKETKQ